MGQLRVTAPKYEPLVQWVIPEQDHVIGVDLTPSSEADDMDVNGEKKNQRHRQRGYRAKRKLKQRDLIQWSEIQEAGD